MADQFTWDTLETNEKREALGRLKQLEDIQGYLDLLREGYTRLLKVNGVSDEGEIIEKKPERLLTKIQEESSSGDSDNSESDSIKTI